MGHSHGAICALGTALLTDDLRSLVVYEPPIPWEIVGPNVFDEAVVSEMEALHGALPNSQVAVLPGQGHLAMNTAPDLFVDEVLAFRRETN